MKPIEFCATSVDCVITTTKVLSRSITYYFSAFVRPIDEDDGGKEYFKGRGENTFILIAMMM